MNHAFEIKAPQGNTPHGKLPRPGNSGVLPPESSLGRAWRRTKLSTLIAGPAALAGLLLIQPATGWAGGVVTTPTEAALRAAIAGGGRVTFVCDGTVTLSTTVTNSLDTVFDATGHQVTINGGDLVRVFYVQTNVTLIINNLTIAQGRSTTSGAGIFNDYGTVNISNSTFTSNNVLGAAGPPWPEFAAGGSAAGGAVANFGVMQFVNCNFTGNSAVGGAGSAGISGAVGAPGGTGAGGSIWNSGTLTTIGCTMYANLAAGGKGGDGGSGMPLPWPTPGCAGGAGGDGSGGVVFNSGFARLINCTFALNTGAGGAGGLGGPGYPNPDYPPPPSGPNGPTGIGIAGLYDASGQCYLTNCTVAFNTGTGIWITQASGAMMVNTLLEENSPANCSGTITDLGHNLSSDMTCNFTSAGSMNNTFALLGSLTNNGGPTLTLALLPGSRAIDTGDTAAAPATDQRGVARPFGVAADIGAYEYSSPSNPGPSSVVNQCTESALRAAISGGGTVTFACDGAITVADTITVTTNITLEACGHHIAITGVGIRLFSVKPNVTLAIANLVITDGSAPEGGGIFSQGIVNATNCVFSGNFASSSGGALRNDGGQVFLAGCVFTGNGSIGFTGESGYGSSAFGGALDNSGTLTADLCCFAANSAVGGGGSGAAGELATPGGSGGASGGGAIRNSGTMTILRSTFMNNSAIGGAGGNGAPGHHSDPGMPFGGGDGGSGGDGGGGEGGAIYSSGTARVFNTTLAYNSGSGGSGSQGGYGGTAYGGASSGGNGANGGTGANGVGAVFNSGAFHLVNSTLVFNSGSGGNGGAGGAGGGGTWGGRGGNGGNGGSGFGGICDQSSSGITNATLALNSGVNGSGGAGGTAGAGSYQNGTPGASGSPGADGGGIGSAHAMLINTILSQNAPGGNCFGAVTDSGHNLSSDSTCSFTATSSMNNTPALLGPLTNNGGPTLSMAILPGSPAIDAGHTAIAPATDQRGFPRPAGAASDIGAFEFGSVMPTLTIISPGGTSLTLVASGNAGQSCRLLTSADLVEWVSVATNQFGSTGTALFQDHSAAGACQFYRLAMP
jgi:hypothetical protein